MKISFIEEIESHKAFTQSKACLNCGSHYYSIHHQLSPAIDKAWWVACNECGYEGIPATSKEAALGNWKC